MITDYSDPILLIRFTGLRDIGSPRNMTPNFTVRRALLSTRQESGSLPHVQNFCKECRTQRFQSTVIVLYSRIKGFDIRKYYNVLRKCP